MLPLKFSQYQYPIVTNYFDYINNMKHANNLTNLRRKNIKNLVMITFKIVQDYDQPYASNRWHEFNSSQSEGFVFPNTIYCGGRNCSI